MPIFFEGVILGYFFTAFTENGFTYLGNENAISGCEMVAVSPSFETRNRILKYKVYEINNMMVFLLLEYYDKNVGLINSYTFQKFHEIDCSIVTYLLCLRYEVEH